MSIKKTLYVGTFISTIGDGVFYIATSWYVYQQMHSSFAVGILLAFSILPVIIVAPFTGHIADKYNRKSITVLMDIVRFLIILICGYVLLLTENQISIWYIYLLSAIVKIADCFFTPCISSLIKINFNDNEYMKIFSVNNTLQQIGSILGSIVTGLLLSQINVVYILFFDSVSFLLSAVIIINMDKSTVIELKESKNNVVQSFRSGLSYILNKKTIMLLIIICGAPSFVVNVLNTLLCEYTEVILGLSVGEYSILDASFGVGCVCMGGIIAFFLSNKEENKLGFIGYLLIPISMFALSITRTFYIAIFEIVFLGALIMVVSINAKTLFAKIVDKEYIGRVDSYSYTINSLFVSLSGIFAGFLSGIINVSWIFRLYSVVCIIFVICYVTLLNKLQMTSKFRE